MFRNKFVFTGFVFIIWMSFFDQNNLLVQIDRLQALNEAKGKADYYLEETEVAKQQLKELLTNEQTLEKFAREKYYMKKPNEDVFVIVK
ncbi:MAG: septum formation initiator family protein [Bacteroidetes bacterium]|nr:septum formation initiator family protein [Bacteroidota bacterium]MBK8488888.1 septum formation initiator family protein [Bacteroidota bacterium]MBK8680739.1 septum formation initiator family protein [Bacteroidota bacterium]